jgi:predicted nucleotidyltransferase
MGGTKMPGPAVRFPLRGSEQRCPTGPEHDLETVLPGATSHAGFDGASPETVASVLGEAVAAIEAEGISYVLLGGLASAIHGRPRCSGDVDLFVRPEDAPRTLGALDRAGFSTDRTDDNWLYKGFMRGVLVDILFKAKRDIYLDDEMIARSTIREFRGHPVRVIPPEDLIVIKAIVHDEETPRHWHDALAIIATGGLDWDYLVRRASKGACRVLSLLLYAASVDLIVPLEVMRQLAHVVLQAPQGEKSP